MRIKRHTRWWTVLLFSVAVLFLADACQSSKRSPKRNGKIPKSGKIPCPIRDC